MKSSEKQVQGTNDSSIVSKASMTNLGYFNDVFVREMVLKSVRRAPLINRGYYLRAKAMEFAISKFLHRYQNCPKHIISLGAGFDSTYFRLRSSGLLEGVVFVEIDFLDVAVRKANIIRDRKLLEDVLRSGDKSDLEIKENNYMVIDRPDYKLLGVSLTQLDVLEASLRAVGLKEDSFVLFMSECVFSYISEKRTSKLIQLLAQSFLNSTFVLYEQIQPFDGFGKLMLSHFRKIGAPLLSLNKHPSIEHQASRFLSKGWRFVEAIDMNEFYFGILSDEERRRVENLEVSDEHEEFHMKCGHYFLLVAQGGDSAAPDPEPYLPRLPPPDCLEAPLTLNACHLPSDLDGDGWRVHTHTCTTLTDSAGTRWLVRIGGYGRDPLRAKGHSRLRSLTFVRDTGGETVHLALEGDELLDASIFRSACVARSDPGSARLLLFGGRVSPLSPSGDLLELCVTSSEAGWAASCRHLGRAADKRGPSPRWRHAACALRVGARPVMLVCGGKTSSGPPLGDAFLFDCEAETWKATAPLPEGGLCSAALTPLSDACALLSGGLDASWRPSPHLWLFSGDTETWRRVELSGSRLTARFGHTAHLLPRDSGEEAVVVLVGGVGGAERRAATGLGVTLLRINAEAATGAVLGEFPVNLNALSEPALLFSHDSILLSGPQVLICGGGGNCFSFGTHLNERLFVCDLRPALALNQS